MIRRERVLALCGGIIGLILAGCGGGSEGSKVTLSEAEGVVLFKGGPFAGATVTFVPDKGPVAIGTTDLEGKFKLSTGATRGVAVGNCKVAVTAVEGGKGEATESPSSTAKKPANEEEMKRRLQAFSPSAQMERTRAAGMPVAKSLINPKFANPDTSDLKATVDKDSSKNKFTFEVTD
jgi:hypothetical protein